MEGRTPGRARWDAALRVGVALLGTLVAVLLGAAVTARRLPWAPDTRFALAFVLIVPTWVGAMCIAFLARSGLRALWVCAAACGLLAAILGLG